MPGEATSSNSAPRPKPSTRSSIRHSLNLAGKALADVINKDNRDSDKNTKKAAKDTTSSRRLSAQMASKSATIAGPRASIGDAFPASSMASRRTETPDSKTVTRRRVSAAASRMSVDELGSKPAEPATPQGTGVVRSASLRPRPGASALPKYRPRSVALEAPKKPPSPVRAGIRRRLSDSEKEDKKPEGNTESPAEKGSRPISPLPQRAAFKTNLTNAVNTTPPQPKAAQRGTPSSSKSKLSPARPTKTAKTASSASAIPRPPSSTSSSGSFAPRTPKTPKTPVSKKSLEQRQKGSPRGSPFRPSSDSPLAHHSRKHSQTSVDEETPNVGNMSHISEGDSEDSEADDVELLLAPVADPTAPTPAMPRVIASRHRRRLPPQTPTRSSNLLPSRANLSYLSPLPPDSANPSPARLRPQSGSGERGGAGRGSILSWEQLATEASRTLGEDEIQGMLSDIPAPFRSGATSPAHVHMEVPESPCLTALNSPGGYGSISQVLLPDVTPSPAVHHHNSRRYDNDASEIPAVDAAIVTLLRLQLASAENTAKERLFQLQAMEEELHNLKEARRQDAEDLATQVSRLEDQMRGSLDARERSEEERIAYTASLEDQLRHAHTFREQAIEDAVTQIRESSLAERDVTLRSQQGMLEAACSARVAATQWNLVHDLADSELDLVKADRELLQVLLSELEQIHTGISCTAL